MALIRKLGKVRHIHHRVCGCLKINCLSIILEKRSVIALTQICCGKCDPILFIDLIKESYAPAVEICIHDDVVSGNKELHECCDGSHTAGKSHSICSVLELCYHILKLLSCRILHPGIIKARTLSKSPVGKGCGLVNWKTQGSPLVCYALVAALTDCLNTVITHASLLFIASYN